MEKKKKTRCLEPNSKAIKVHITCKHFCFSYHNLTSHPFSLNYASIITSKYKDRYNYSVKVAKLLLLFLRFIHLRERESTSRGRGRGKKREREKQTP